MISKIPVLQGIGRFHKFASGENSAFQKLTLIFAENGKGKSTLSDILRSLATGRADYVLGRSTLGGTHVPYAHIVIDGGTSLMFKQNAWTGQGPRISIYDSTFVHENVHSGHFIEKEHRKNLYGVIVGEAGVVLAKKVEDYAEEIKKANSDNAGKEKVIKALIPAGFRLETFLEVAKIPDIDEKIEQKVLEIRSLELAGAIQSTGTLQKIDLPELPVGLETLLAKTLEDIAVNSEAQVKAHVARSGSTECEGWIAKGLSLARGNNCPYCEQDVSSVTLIEAYRDFFSENYTGLRREIASARVLVGQMFGESVLLRIQGRLVSNLRDELFWKSTSLTISLPTLPFADLFSVLTFLRDQAIARLTAKNESPLDERPGNAEFQSALLSYDKLSARVSEYNEAVVKAQLLIEDKKATTDASILPSAKAALAQLQGNKKRHESEVANACQDYLDGVAHKDSLDKEKAKARKELDRYCDATLAPYEKRINQLLTIFGASFSIRNTKTGYPAGAPSSSFQIVINGQPVEVGGSDSSIGVPSFRNTLSGGDRSTLALAFFIAQIEVDPKLSETIVVFDDPFTSQDDSRRNRTRQMIADIALRCKQVIVLSHDPLFLRGMFGKSQADVAVLQIYGNAKLDAKMASCDLEKLTRRSYFIDYDRLQRYADGANFDDLLSVGRSIRPVLEEYLRVKYPNQFGPTSRLGMMIKPIQQAQAGSELENAKPLLNELKFLNDHTASYHHAEDGHGTPESINDDELRQMVKVTLALIAK